MPRSARPKPHVLHHRDGSVWARGQTLQGVATGFWRWFRKDGTVMRSGSFEAGRQVGEWTTYDKHGDVVKVSTMKPAAAAPRKKATSAGPRRKRA
jgi:hypothetical protein